MAQQTVYLLIRHYSDEGVGTFDTTEAVFADETVAELRALEKNEATDRHPSCEYGVEPMPVL